MWNDLIQAPISGLQTLFLLQIFPIIQTITGVLNIFLIISVIILIIVIIIFINRLMRHLFKSTD